MNNSSYHKSVLVKEVIEYLNPQPNKLYIDATFGGGGHTQAILDAEPNCTVLAIDWDQNAIDKNAEPLQEKYGDRLKIAWGNFALLHRILKKEKIKKIDGLLADFGTSQFQIHNKEGFSFNTDSPLDMRMSTSHYRHTAADVVNNFEEKQLASIFFEYGEESNSRKIARAICEDRKKKLFKTTRQLAELIENITPYTKQRRRIHPATKVFQALRIYVNKELENIETLLKNVIPFLNEDGKILCISFHSLEDRIVKIFFRENTDKLKILTKKPIIPSEEEITTNPSARSSKLRVAKKIN